MGAALSAKVKTKLEEERPVLLKFKLQRGNGKLNNRCIDFTQLLPEMEAIVEGHTTYVPYLRDATDCIKYLIERGAK